jgi:hypothetical protein
VIRSLHIDYKGTRIKPYHKEGQALRTETTINNTRDFYIRKSLNNLPALGQIGFQANRRLLQTQTITHDCFLAEEPFQQLNQPRSADNQRVSPYVLLTKPSTLSGTLYSCSISCHPASQTGISRHNLAGLLGHPLDYFTQGRMTYQLRRLRLHGLIARIPKTHRYRLLVWLARRSILYPHLQSHLAS